VNPTIILALQAPQPETDGVIVKLIEPPDTRIADLLIATLGLSGALLLGAVLIGLVVGGLVFWVRSKNTVTESANRLH
jgi:hypothetical protein